MRSVRLYSILACTALVYSQTDTSFDNLFPDEPDTNNFFLNDNSGGAGGGGLFSSEPINPDDSALLHSTPLSDASNDNTFLQSNLLAGAPDGIALPDSSTLLTANPPDNACTDTSPPWNRLRARQRSCKNPDADSEGLENKNSLTDEEVKKHWCPETNAPFRGFGNIPVCSRREPEGALAEAYHAVLENVELITSLIFDSCPLKNVWCCNVFLENLGYFEEFSLLYPTPTVPPGTGYACVKGFKKIFTQDPLDLASLPS